VKGRQAIADHRQNRKPARQVIAAIADDLFQGFRKNLLGACSGDGELALGDGVPTLKWFRCSTADAKIGQRRGQDSAPI
jgi:hypothetical protein